MSPAVSDYKQARLEIARREAALLLFVRLVVSNKNESVDSGAEVTAHRRLTGILEDCLEFHVAATADIAQ